LRLAGIANSDVELTLLLTACHLVRPPVIG
jgi:hypothetical protein